MYTTQSRLSQICISNRLRNRHYPYINLVINLALIYYNYYAICLLYAIINKHYVNKKVLSINYIVRVFLVYIVTFCII